MPGPSVLGSGFSGWDSTPRSSSQAKKKKAKIYSSTEVMDWTPETPEPSRAEKRRMRELNEYRIQLEIAVARDQALLAAIVRRAQQPPTSFQPDGTIRLLPEYCGINLAAVTQFPSGGRVLQIEPFEKERPELKPLKAPLELVGKVKATFDANKYRATDPFRNPDKIVEHPGGWEVLHDSQAGELSFVPKIAVDPPTPSPGRDVWIRPKSIAPYFDLVTIEQGDYLIVEMNDVELNESADAEHKRLELLHDILEKWEGTLTIQFTTFKVQAMNWRNARREWELETVQEIFLSGNLDMLPPKFDIQALLDARKFIWEARDREFSDCVEVHEHICERELCEKAVSIHDDVKMTMFRVKEILFNLIPSMEQSVKRQILEREMAEFDNIMGGSKKNRHR